MNTIFRRVTPARLYEEFSESVKSVRDMFYRSGSFEASLAEFRNAIISMTIDGIHWELYSTMPEESNWYDNVFYELRRYFDNRIEEIYNELKNQ